MKEIILQKLSGGGYVSGAEIADSLGVSRNAVWKCIQSLKNDGYTIESVTSKGYRISPECDKISAEFISYKGKIIVLDEIDSTNNYAKKITAEGANHGTVVIAESQNSGKGRFGRSFVSPSGMGLYMSIILRPKFSVEYAPLITSAVAVAVVEALEKFAECEFKIKWVNDIYLNGKKICGILTEASLGLECNSLDYAVAGIGINVRDYDFGELSQRVSSIERETGKILNRNRLCREILNRLDFWIGRITERAHLDKYRERELLTGNMISADFGAEKIIGKAIGIDDNANLMVQTENGIIHLSSGEANLIRKIQEVSDVHE